MHMSNCSSINCVCVYLALPATLHIAHKKRAGIYIVTSKRRFTIIDVFLHQAAFQDLRDKNPSENKFIWNPCITKHVQTDLDTMTQALASIL